MKTRKLKRTEAKDTEEESEEIQTNKLKHNQLDDSVLENCRIIYLQCSPIDTYKATALNEHSSYKCR